MKDERKLSTSDIAAATDREVRRETSRISLDRERRLSTPDPPPSPAPDGPRTVEEPVAQLFAAEDAAAYRTRWSGIQTGFVDEPRKAVEEADTLVAEVMKRLAEGFATERQGLEKQWERADQVSTEDLRLAMRRYRSFFERLLAV
jgi:hypothetical protein